jgi:hypothetical protein
MPGLNVRFHVLFDATPGLLSALGGRYDDFNKTLEAAMSQISDKIAELNTSLDEATARITADVADLQAKIDAGGATADDLAALDAFKARLDAIDPVPDQPPVEPPDDDPVNPD